MGVTAVDALPADLDAARAAAELAHAEAQRSGDDVARAVASTSLATLRWAAGDLAGAAQAWRAALPFLRTGAAAEAELAAAVGLARVAGAEGMWDEAQRWLARAVEVAGRSGVALLQARARLAGADLAERRGRVTEALQATEVVFTGHPDLAADHVVRRCLRLGDPARARGVWDWIQDDRWRQELVLQEGGAVPPGAMSGWAAALRGAWDDVAGPTRLLAWRALARGDADGALGAFDAERIRLAADGWPVEAALVGLGSVGALAAAGRTKAGAGLLAELELLVEDADLLVVAPSFDLARARLARATGDETAAQALAATARARVPVPPLALQVDLRVFGA
jgi:hypothetical protein